ncbi:MAG: sarcosine oxidase subunit gamma [Pseudomonadota bacterium]
MAKLIALSPFDALLPLELGAVRATDMSGRRITSIAPFNGQKDAVSTAVLAQTGIALPPTGCANQSANWEVLWAGLDVYFVIGGTLTPIAGAAMTDQSDAWAVIDLAGPDAAEVLTRLVPIDLAMDVGRTARTLLGHMNCLLHRTEEQTFRIYVFRSMAGTAAHEIKAAMAGLAARKAL